MEKKDRPRFKLTIDKTALTLPSQNLDAKEKTLRIEAFWEIFQKFKIEEVEAAFAWAREELKYFPVPNNLIEFIRKERNAEYNRKIEIEDRKIMEQRLLDWREHAISPERTHELLNKLFKSINKEIGPVIEGEEAEEFERKRLIAKEKAKRLLAQN